MKQTFKLSLLLLLVAPLFFITSCEENAQSSCNNFAISIDYNTIDSTSVDLTAVTEGGEPDFTYSWNTGVSTASINVTEFDTYSITVTDGNNCTASVDFVIDSFPSGSGGLCDAFAAFIYDTMIDSEAYLEAIAFGGMEPYEFVWSNGDTGYLTEVTTPGIYTATIVDANNCVVSVSYTVQDSSNTLCDGFFATITEDIGSNSSYLNAQANAGTAPFTYLWSTNSTSQAIEVNIPGDYIVTITDANGCIAGATYTYVQGGGLCDYPVYIELVVDPATSDTSLYAVIDSAGIGPFTYLWSNGATTESTIILGLGIYTVTVSDANGCVHTVTYDHLMNGPCDNYDVFIASFPDSNSVYVALSADVIAGSSPFVYNWSNGESIPVISVEENTGSYTVTVTDANGCFDEDTIQL